MRPSILATGALSGNFVDVPGADARPEDHTARVQNHVHKQRLQTVCTDKNFWGMNFKMLGVKELLPNGRIKRMIKLEKLIAPPPVSGGIDPDEDETEYAARTIELINGIATGSLNSNEFSDYIKTCLEDPQIAALAAKRKISEERFVRIFRMLATAGLNRELKGRNIALATLGDYTCLLYVVRAVRKGTDWQTISSELEEYWRGKRDPKALLNQTTRSAA